MIWTPTKEGWGEWGLAEGLSAWLVLGTADTCVVLSAVGWGVLVSSFLEPLGLRAPQEQGHGLGMPCCDCHGGLWTVVLVWLGVVGAMGDWQGLVAT